MSTKRGAVLLQFDPNELLVIGVDTKDGPEHELWDERIKLPLDEPMVLNLMAIGVKQAIVVRKSMAQAGKYEVVDGRGRVLHSREANKRLKKAGEPLISVPGAVETGDEVFMESLAIALNENRRDDDTLVKAEKCKRLLDRNGGDLRAAAVVFGVSVAAIKTWVKLASVTPKVKRAIAAGDIAASAAVELHGLEKDAQNARLDRLLQAKAKGRKATTSNAKKEAGKRTVVPKRVLLKLVRDHGPSVHAEMVSGIKLALGMYVPPESTKLGKLLAQSGLKYGD
jgi:ParB family chromosome partitioning protein